MRNLRHPATIAGLVLSLLLLLCACVRPAHREQPLPTLIIGSDNYRPFNYYDDNGLPAGIDVELAVEACRRMGYTPEFHQISWDAKDELLASGEVDCLWGGFSMNGRESRYQWAGPYMHSLQVVAVPSNSTIDKLSDLAGKLVAVQLGSKPEEMFLTRDESRIPEVKNVYSLVEIDEVIAAMRKNYVDACAGHAAALTEMLELEGVSYRILSEPLLRASLGVAFSPDGDSALCQQLSETFTQMLADGTVQQILEKYGLDAEKALEGIES